MKIKIVFFVLLCSFYGFSQTVGIGTSTPSASAQLEVFANNKGVLFPKVALTGGTADVDAIATGNVEGLLVYNTSDTLDVVPGYYYWTGSVWAFLGSKAYSGKIVFSAEYEGASLVADGNKNKGSMSVQNTGGVGNNGMNYYQWSSEETVMHDYDVVLRFVLPDDFVAWATDDNDIANAIVIDYVTETLSLGENGLSVKVFLESSQTDLVTVENTASTWSTIALPATNLSSLVAGNTVVMVLKMSSSGGNYVRLGDITLNYTYMR